MLLFIRSLYRTRPRTPSGHCSLYSFRIGAWLVLCLFCICLLFVFHLFLYLLHICSWLVPHLSFSLVHSLATCRSPFCFASCTLCTSFIFRLLFISRSLYTCSQPVANLFPICFARFPLVPYLFSTCAPFVLFSFIRHLFIPHTLDVYSPFVSCSPPLHHSMFSILLWSWMWCVNAGQGSPPRVTCMCTRICMCVARSIFRSKFPRSPNRCQGETQSFPERLTRQTWLRGKESVVIQIKMRTRPHVGIQRVWHNTHIRTRSLLTGWEPSRLPREYVPSWFLSQKISRKGINGRNTKIDRLISR